MHQRPSGRQRFFLERVLSGRTFAWFVIWTMLEFTVLHRRDPAVSTQLGTFYGAMDLKTSTQMFIREVTPDLLTASSS